MRTKVVFSGTLLIAIAAVAIVTLLSRNSNIAANVYYYCWECASVGGELGCAQVQYETPDHSADPVCPEGTYQNEGLCSLACADPVMETSESSVLSVSSVSSDGEHSEPVSSKTSPDSSSSSSYSSKRRRIVIGLGDQSVSFVFAGIVFTMMLVVVIGFIAWLRRQWS